MLRKARKASLAWKGMRDSEGSLTFSGWLCLLFLNSYLGLMRVEVDFLFLLTKLEGIVQARYFAGSR